MFQKFLLLALIGLLGCGTNAFESLDEEDISLRAVNYLERGESDKAIELLEAALVDDPYNYEYVSLLSSAYAQKFKVEILDLALAMARSQSSESTGTSPIAILWPFLPEATSENVDGVSLALTILELIPTSERLEADYFKMALLSMAAVSIRTKSFDLNGDGKLSLQELARMSDADAALIIANILTASSSLGNAGELDKNSKKAGESITGIANGISSQEGGGEAEQLANYFAEVQN